MIYYIYKVRRKQTSIRFSRSALSHRYLRSISWISWNGHRPPQAGFPPVLHTEPQPAHAPFSRRRLYSKAAIAALLPLLPPRREQLLSDFPPRKRKTILFLSFARLSCVAPPVLRHPRAPHAPPTLSSAAGLSPAVHVAFCGLPINKKCGPAALRCEPAQKSVDFSLKKTHVGTPGFHALASAARTYSSTARIHYCPFSFLLFYKGKEKRKQKQIQQVRIHRSDSLRSSSRCTRLAPAPRPLKQR